MHICFLCDEYPPASHGGVGSKIQVLGRGLAGRGHRVSVVGIYQRARTRVPPDGTVEDDQGVRVIRLPHSPVRHTGFLVNGRRLRRSLLELHRKYPIDILEGTELALAPLPRAFPAAMTIRMCGGHHFFAATLGQQPRPWRSWLERRSFRRADGLAAVSQFVAETTRTLLGLGSRPVEILPNPVDVTAFAPLPHVPEEEGLIVFVGTVCEKKGVRQLLDAMPAIMQAVPHVRLWIVGRDAINRTTGVSYTAQYRGRLPEALREHVVFHGPAEHAALPGLLARAQVCVYPSHMEAQGIVNLEGMAMAKAVVSSRTGPGPEVVEDGVSGLLCDPYDPASIADRVIRLLKDASLRRQLGHQGRMRVERLFSNAALLDRNEAFFRRCVEQKS
jgi:glycosyltransferase involved in cell wall biosynthesis